MSGAQDWRQRRRQAVIEEIKQAARAQIAEHGAGSLSLGAVARALGMTPPALYRYFANRDALVAALVIDAYDSMGEALENAAADVHPADYAGQFQALMHAYRSWAVAHAQHYALMSGLPAADIEMSPAQQQAFLGATLRSMRAMVDVLHASYAAGQLDMPAPYHDPPSSVRQALVWMQTALGDATIPLEVLALALTTWIRADGLVWQELHGHFPRSFFGDGAFYDMESRVLVARLGLDAGEEGKHDSGR